MPDASPDATVPAPTGCRILVVDDNVDAALSLAEVLSMLGHETAVAHDGLQALEVAPAFEPQIVFLDIGMPRMNGYETARHMRQTPWGARLPLVALTGWGNEKERQLAREAGFDHHLVKPCDFTDIEAILQKAVPGSPCNPPSGS